MERRFGTGHSQTIPSGHCVDATVLTWNSFPPADHLLQDYFLTHSRRNSPRHILVLYLIINCLPFLQGKFHKHRPYIDGLTVTCQNREQNWHTVGVHDILLLPLPLPSPAFFFFCFSPSSSSFLFLYFSFSSLFSYHTVRVTFKISFSNSRSYRFDSSF